MKKKTILTVVLTSLLGMTGALAAPAAYSAEPSVKVLDTTAIITDPGWFVSAYNAGFRMYVMHSTAWGTCTPWYRTQTQLKMALDAGLRIAVYTRNPECWQGGIEATGPYREQLEFFALDVELGEPLITRDMVDGVRDMGVRPIVYGIATHWPLMMGDSSEFSDLPLWDGDFHHGVDYAQWTPDHLSPAPVSYGGWNVPGNMRVGVQQKLSQDVGGIMVDLNSFSPDFLR